MGTKAEPGEFDCHAKALPDEPLFTFLARDANAPKVIRDWAALRRAEIDAYHRPESDRGMIEEAEACADAMESWRAANYGKWWQAAG